MLEARNLEVVRDERVLFRGLGFTLEPGGLLQITGPNGAGKTSLLSVLTGLLAPETGEVCWSGTPIHDVDSTYHATMTYLGHLPGLKTALTPWENLRFLASLRGLSVRQPEVLAALERVGLRGYDHVPVAQMSAGQRRRVALARLFLENSRLWILDEPFTAIDKHGVRELEGWLQDHVAAGGLVVLTTHHELPAVPGWRQLDVSQYRPGRLA